MVFIIGGELCFSEATKRHILQLNVLFVSLLGNLRLLIFRITIQKCVLIPVMLLIFWCFLRLFLTSHHGIACLSPVVSYVIYPFHTKELLPGSSVALRE